MVWWTVGLPYSLTQTSNQLPIMCELICKGLEGKRGYYWCGHVASSLVENDAHWPLRA